MATIKIKMAERQEDYAPQGKTYTIYSWQCFGEVDGQETTFALKTFSKKNVDLVVKDAVLENVEAKEFKGKMEYIIPKPEGGFGGGGSGGGGKFAPNPARDLSIARQCAFKGAIELVVAGKLDNEKVKPFVEKWGAYLAGQDAKAPQQEAPQSPPSRPAAPPPADDGDDQALPF